jgi:hypothetical protein
VIPLTVHAAAETDDLGLRRHLLPGLWNTPDTPDLLEGRQVQL